MFICRGAAVQKMVSLTHINEQALVKSVYQKNSFSYFSIQTYVVGTQKNRLNETVLLST